MSLSSRNRHTPDTKSKSLLTLIAGLIVLVVPLLRTLTGFVVQGFRNFGGISVVLVIVFICSLLGLLAAGFLAMKRDRGSEPWGRPKKRDDDLMHLDHYRRTKRERTNYSADPCAYSERYSWRKSQSYDDPWDF